VNQNINQNAPNNFNQINNNFVQNNVNQNNAKNNNFNRLFDRIKEIDDVSIS
jgi:hypothetical protein